jgi:hypothetical protein
VGRKSERFASLNHNVFLWNATSSVHTRQGFDYLSDGVSERLFTASQRGGFIVRVILKCPLKRVKASCSICVNKTRAAREGWVSNDAKNAKGISLQ